MDKTLLQFSYDTACWGGRFSFSLCLARAFGSATKMFATSLDSIGKLMRSYEKAVSNICELEQQGCKVIHGVDATIMAEHSMLQGLNFDRIIFNFPHAGFHRNERRETQITNHRLVYLFFENAKKLVHEEGEIHVINKSVGFYHEWNIVTLASLSGLKLVEEVMFNLEDYPGYSNK